jgi:hypothetical protein
MGPAPPGMERAFASSLPDGCWARIIVEWTTGTWLSLRFGAQHRLRACALPLGEERLAGSYGEPLRLPPPRRHTAGPMEVPFCSNCQASIWGVLSTLTAAMTGTP